VNLENFVKKGLAAQKAVDEVIAGSKPPIEHGRKAEKIIWELILSFPCLRTKFNNRPWTEGGKIWFDAERLDQLSEVWSTGERQCVMFVLNVWNPAYAKHRAWEFDIFDFIGTADPGNRQALINWLNKPIWP
jgi:hypothetical protein